MKRKDYQRLAWLKDHPEYVPPTPVKRSTEPCPRCHTYCYGDCAGK